MDAKRAVLETLRTSKEVYTLLARTTNLPLVECDPQTYDDQILLFLKEEDAKKRAECLIKEKIPVQVIKVEKKSFLSFYTSLYPMGVNCIVVHKEASERIAIQLDELVRRAEPSKLPKGQIWIENPQLHLTAIYFVQELRKATGQPMTEEMKELYEEMLAHFGRGKYIFAVGPNQEVPALKGGDGEIYQPLFTDPHEFQKFNRGQKFRAAAVEAGKIKNLLTAKSNGVVINPMGVNVLLKMAKRNEKDQIT